MWNQIAELWCKTMHGHAMWPIHGKYICSRCLREYLLDWEGPATPEEYAQLLDPEPPLELDARVWLPE